MIFTFEGDALTLETESTMAISGGIADRPAGDVYKRQEGGYVYDIGKSYAGKRGYSFRRHIEIYRSCRKQRA